MLVSRVATSLLLIPFVIFAIWELPNSWFAVMAAALLSLGVWEWTALMRVKQWSYRALYLLLWLVIIGMLAMVGPKNWSILLLMGGLWWLIVFFYILSYSPSTQTAAYLSVRDGLFGCLLFTFCWLGLTHLKLITGDIYIIFILFLIWALDTMAYLGGKRWGRRKLIVKISPNKTVEGLAIGLLTASVLILMAKWLFTLSWERWLGLASISILAVLFAVVGDLFESMIKRQAGIKDSGWLLPGHGGVLDRIDSMLAAIPVFALGMQWWLR